MRAIKASLAILVSASLALPASAQVRAAASMAGSALPRVSLSAPLAPSALLAAPSAPSLPAFAAPSAAFTAAALENAPAPVASVRETGAAAPAAAIAAAPSAAALQTQAAALEAAPSAAASVRTRWESFWSGSPARSAIDASAEGAVQARSSAPRSLSRPGARAASSTPTRAAAAAVLFVPTAHGFSSILAQAPPFLEAGAVLVGAYFVDKGIRSLLGRFAAARGMDRHQVAVIRLVTSVMLWTGAATAALAVGGASHQTLTAVLGAGGTMLTLGLRDFLGNVSQGVNFLIARPYSIGARVQVEGQTGTVSDATLTSLIIKKDDGAIIKIRHSSLSAKTVVVLGEYVPESKSKFSLSLPAKPRFQGALGAVFKSLDLRFWLASAAFAALLAGPAFLPLLTAGWAATAVHYALIGSIAWLTRRVDVALSAAVDQLARANSWRRETAVITRLAVSSALWTLGGGAALRLLGVSWAAFGASLGLTTLGIGFASNNFFASLVQSGETLFAKPFKIGDAVKIGLFEGTVEDMTLNHVVLKLDEGRHALVPYSIVSDATLVVTPGKQE